MSGKSDQRLAGRRARRNLTRDEREQNSLDITRHLCNSTWFRRAENIGCYLASDEEVNTWAFIERALRMKKRIFVPVLKKSTQMKFVRYNEKSNLVTNRFGLAEPASGEELQSRMLDFVVTPLVAFDADGNRIGMGGGYFDRTFAFLNHRTIYRHPKLIGLSFACQQVGRIGASPWDIPLFQVYTENGPAIDR